MKFQLRQFAKNFKEFSAAIGMPTQSFTAKLTLALAHDVGAKNRRLLFDPVGELAVEGFQRAEVEVLDEELVMCLPYHKKKLLF